MLNIIWEIHAMKRYVAYGAAYTPESRDKREGDYRINNVQIYGDTGSLLWYIHWVYLTERLDLIKS